MKKLTDFGNFKLSNLKSIYGGNYALVEAGDSDNGGPIDPVKRPTGGSTTTTSNDRP